MDRFHRDLTINKIFYSFRLSGINIMDIDFMIEDKNHRLHLLELKKRNNNLDYIDIKSEQLFTLIRFSIKEGQFSWIIYYDNSYAFFYILHVKDAIPYIKKGEKKILIPKSIFKKKSYQEFREWISNLHKVSINDY